MCDTAPKCVRRKARSSVAMLRQALCTQPHKHYIQTPTHTHQTMRTRKHTYDWSHACILVGLHVSHPSLYTWSAMHAHAHTPHPPLQTKACPAFLVIATPFSCAAAVAAVVMHSCAAAAAVDSCVNGHGGILRLGQALFLCCTVQFHLPGILSLSLSVYSLSPCLVSAPLSEGRMVSVETKSNLRCASVSYTHLTLPTKA